MQLPGMQPMPPSNPVPPPSTGGLQSIAPQQNTSAPTPPPMAPSPYPAPPSAPASFAPSDAQPQMGAPAPQTGTQPQTGAPPASVNPGAQPPVVQQLAQQGRNGDSTLVHMNPEEVSGLQALAQSKGTSLTVNPQTGLPEAFNLGGFLKGMLPTIIGMVAAPFTGGLINPWTVGAAVGAGKMATGGSLTQGLMAGLGAYSGMGLGTSLMNAGSSAAGAGATSAANTAGAAGAGAVDAGAADALGLAPGATAAALPTAAGLTAEQVAAQQASVGAMGGLAADTGVSAITPAIAPSVLSAPAAGLAGIAAPPAVPVTVGQTLAHGAQTMGAGVHNAIAPLPAGADAATIAAHKAAQSALLYKAIPAAGSALLMGMSPTDTSSSPTTSTGYNRPYLGPYSFSGAKPSFPTTAPSLTAPTNTGEFNYFPDRKVGSAFAVGDPQAVQDFLAKDPNAKKDAFGKINMTADERRQLADQQAHVAQYGWAKGGLTLENGAFVVDARTVSELGNGSSSAGQELLAKHGGQPIHGKGDGVSDSIHANIGGTQEARVARDEVKFSPQSVARIGGGDQKQGAKKLYAMMDRAAKARKAANRGEDTGLRGLMAIR